MKDLLARCRRGCAVIGKYCAPTSNQIQTRSPKAVTPVVAGSPFPVWLIAALLALVTMALYWPATGHAFVDLDDDLYVLDNPHVQRIDLGRLEVGVLEAGGLAIGIP